MRTLHFFRKTTNSLSGVGWWTVQWFGWVVWMGIRAWITSWVARMKRMWTRWLKRSHVVRRWSTDWGKFCSDPPFTLPLHRQSEVGTWIVPLDVPSRSNRFPIIQQAHSRSDIGSNYGGWTTSRTKNRNVNGLLNSSRHSADWRPFVSLFHNVVLRCLTLICSADDLSKTIAFSVFVPSQRLVTILFIITAFTLWMIININIVIRAFVSHWNCRFLGVLNAAATSVHSFKPTVKVTH